MSVNWILIPGYAGYETIESFLSSNRSKNVRCTVSAHRLWNSAKLNTPASGFLPNPDRAAVLVGIFKQALASTSDLDCPYVYFFNCKRDDTPKPTQVRIDDGCHRIFLAQNMIPFPSYIDIAVPDFQAQAMSSFFYP